jgi:hypothetical protein
MEGKKKYHLPDKWAQKIRGLDSSYLKHINKKLIVLIYGNISKSLIPLGNQIFLRIQP